MYTLAAHRDQILSVSAPSLMGPTGVFTYGTRPEHKKAAHFESLLVGVGASPVTGRVTDRLPLSSPLRRIREEKERNDARVYVRDLVLFLARLLRIIHQDEWMRMITTRWAPAYGPLAHSRARDSLTGPGWL
jgi:hypothetical protein